MAKPDDDLAWFPFYVQKWMTNDEVLELSGDQMAAYLWLLCLQWRRGHLPYEAQRVARLCPKGIPELDVSFALLKFFPPDPDTNERRNPKLARIRERQMRAYHSRLDTAKAARKSKKDKGVSSDYPSDYPKSEVSDQRETLSFSISLLESFCEKGGVGGNAVALRDGLKDYPDALLVLEGLLKAARSPVAVLSSVRALGPGGTRETGSWGHLAAGLVEAAAIPGTPTPNLIAGCVRKAKERKPEVDLDEVMRRIDAGEA